MEKSMFHFRCSVTLFLSLWMTLWSTAGDSRSVSVRTKAQDSPTRKENAGDSYLIEPGKGVGRIRLGDSREHVFDVLEFEAGQAIQTDNCGAEYIAIDKKSHPQG